MVCGYQSRTGSQQGSHFVSANKAISDLQSGHNSMLTNLIKPVIDLSTLISCGWRPSRAAGFFVAAGAAQSLASLFQGFSPVEWAPAGPPVSSAVCSLLTGRRGGRFFAAVRRKRIRCYSLLKSLLCRKVALCSGVGILR
jgi:hypothetical protein